MEMPQLQLLDEQDSTHTHESGTNIELPEFIFSDFDEEPLHTGFVPDQKNNECSVQFENNHQDASSVINPPISAQAGMREARNGALPSPESALRELEDIEGANFEFDCSLIVPPPLTDGLIDSAAPSGDQDVRDSTNPNGIAPFQHAANTVQENIPHLEPLIEPRTEFYNHLHGQSIFPTHDTNFEDTLRQHIAIAQSSVGIESNQAFQGVRNHFFSGLDVAGMMPDGIAPHSSAELGNVAVQASEGNGNLLYDGTHASPFSLVSPGKDFPNFDDFAASQVNGLQTGGNGEMNGGDELLPSGYSNERENETGLIANANEVDGVNFGDFVSNPAIVPPLPVDSLPARSSGKKRRLAPPTSSNRVTKKSRTKVQDLDPALVHVCTVEGCNRKFAKKYNLKIHLRRHNGDLPFLCEYSGCSKRFMWLSSFSRHQRVHESKQHKKRKLHELGGGDDDDVVGEEDGATLVRIGGVVNRVEHACRDSVVLASCLKAMEGSPPKRLLEVWRQKPVETNEWRVKQVKAYQERGYNMENEGVIRVCESLRRERKRRLAAREQAGSAEL